MKTSVGVALCMDDHDRAILTYNETIDADLAADFTDALLDGCRHIHIASYFLMKRMQKH
jgi:hypothetical protein